MSDQFPTVGRLAGIDFGTVRIGIAISDQNQTLASPFENYQVRTDRLDAKYFEAFNNEEQIKGFVVGLPVHNSGDESEKSKQAREFGRWLTEVTRRPVKFFDERFTTAMARELMQEANLSPKQRKKRLDKIAAQIILASYLESDRKDAVNQALDDQ